MAVSEFSHLRNIIFDFDGTLADSYTPVTESFNHMMAHFGRGALTVEEVRPWVGTGLEVEIARLVGEKNVEEGVRVFREHYVTVYLDGTKLLPGAGEVLDELSPRFRMALCSNKRGDILRELASHLGIVGKFGAILGAEDVPHLKPHPAMLRKAMASIGASADDTLYVGDTVTDVRFARACGLPYALVLGGSGTREELLAQRPIALLGSVADLPALLDGGTR